MKKLVLTVFTFLALFNCGLAHADQVTATFTGDNNVAYWNGSAWINGTNNWQDPASVTFKDNGLSSIAYFAVSNDYTTPAFGNNPAGFLASFTDSGGTFAVNGSNTLLSNTTNFSILAVSPWVSNPSLYPYPDVMPNPTQSPSTLIGSSIFGTPTSYGTNGSNSIWLPANGGPIAGIDNSAEWLWTGPGTNDGTFDQNIDYALIGVNIGITGGNTGNNNVVPEPPTLLLFAFAGALLVLLNRKKMFAAA